MKRILFCCSMMAVFVTVYAQQSIIDSNQYPAPVNFTSQQNQDDMMKQLGIKNLRPGPSGDENAPNHANYDTSKADPCPQLPDILTLKNGRKVSTADTWSMRRRPEIIEDYEREVYGRIPKNTPKVHWQVNITDREFVGFISVLAKQITGHVDNSGYPLINVEIKMIIVLPVNVKGPVPVLIMFGWNPSFPSPTQPSVEDMEKLNKVFKEMMIKTDPSVKVIFDANPAYTPVSRLPFPNFSAPRGETSPTEGGEFYWMAGNFLKYGAAEKTGCDLPVDAHELIALCAPRPTFISYGIPDKGDANWLDQRGSYMATVAAGTAFKLLGAKDLGVSNDYISEKKPLVNTGLLEGQLAWRQHDGGHTDAPNFKYFIPWANKMLNYEKKSL